MHVCYRFRVSKPIERALLGLRPRGGLCQVKSLNHVGRIVWHVEPSVTKNTRRQQHYLGGFLHGHLGQQQLLYKFDIASVIERAKHQHAFEYFADDQHSSLVLCKTMQLEYKPALSVVKYASNRTLMSSFRTGCRGLRVDTGRWADGVYLDRTDRLCLVCKSLDRVEDVQLCVFDCPWASVQPCRVTAVRPPAALLYHCRLSDIV